jgi:heme-degrading monooxygenase HmoA
VSVIVTIEFPGVKADKFMEAFQRDPERMKRIAEDGRSQGAIHHLVTANEDGTVMVVDEWDSRENCERFVATAYWILPIDSEPRQPSSLQWRRSAVPH